MPVVFNSAAEFKAVWDVLDQLYGRLGAQGQAQNGGVLVQNGDYLDPTPFLPHSIDLSPLTAKGGWLADIAAGVGAETIGEAGLAINLGFIMVANAYVDYILDGGAPLLAIAKPRDPLTDPGQSYHDNILSNLNPSNGALGSRFLTSPANGMEFTFTDGTPTYVVGTDPRSADAFDYGNARPQFGGFASTTHPQGIQFFGPTIAWDLAKGIDRDLLALDTRNLSSMSGKFYLVETTGVTTFTSLSAAKAAAGTGDVLVSYNGGALFVENYGTAGSVNDDWFIAQAGNQVIDGGAGSDTYSLEGNTNGGYVDLGAGIAFGGAETGFDTLISIENVAGGSGSDVLTGNGNNNIFYASTGADIINGGSPATGTDSDTFDASAATGSVNINLQTGSATGDLGMGALNTTLSNIENATGGSGADILTGNGAINILVGNGGNDIFRNVGAGDTVDGGEGLDTVEFAGNYADYTITWDGTTAIVKLNGAAEGVSITDASLLRFGNGVDVRLVAEGGTDYASLQAAIDASDDGDIVLLAEGSYSGLVTINDKAISLIGQGDVLIAGQINVTGDISGNQAVRFVNLDIDATGRSYGVNVRLSSADNGGTVVFDSVNISNAKMQGVFYAHPSNASSPTNPATIGAFEFLNSTFANNGYQSDGSGGTAHVNLFGFVGDLKIHNVTLDGPDAASATPHKAFTVRGLDVPGTSAPGVGGYPAAGTLDIFNLNISGYYTQDAVGFYRIGGFESIVGIGINFTDTAAPWGLVNFDSVAGIIDFSGVVGTNLVPGSAVVLAQGLNGSETFTGSAQNDVFFGRGGADTLNGGAGDDVFQYTTTTSGQVHTLDAIDGGDGIDTIRFQAATSSELVIDGPVSGVEKVVLVGTGGANLSVDASALDQGMEFVGDAGNNSIIGTSGSDLIKGGAGNDRLDGRGGADIIDGGDGVDTAVYADDVSIGWSDENGWTAGDDTLTNVEVVEAGGARYLLVGEDAYATIADALAAATGGEIILIADGTYTESLVLPVGVTLQAVNPGMVTITAANAADSVISVSGDLDGADVAVNGINLRGGARGISVDGANNVGVLSVSGSTLEGHSVYAIWVADNGVEDLVVTDTQLADNGTFANNAAGHIKLFGYTNNASFTRVEIVGGTGGAAPNTAIELTGTQNGNLASGSFPIGTVVFDGVVITGAFDRSPFSVYNYADVLDLEILDLDVSGASTAWATINFDGIAGAIDGSAYVITLAPGQLITLQGEKPAQGADLSNTITGTAYDDIIVGKSGDDVLNGGDGNDYLIGGDGSDTLNGGAGDDRLEGGPGANVLDGGDGVDTAVYSTDVAIGWSSAGGWTAGLDGLSNIEVVEAGSARYLLVGDGGYVTIGEALAAATGGETILIADGTYTESLVLPVGVTLKAVNAGAVTISAANAGDSVISFSGDLGGADVSISGINLRDGARGISVEGANNLGKLSVSGSSLEGHDLYAIWVADNGVADLEVTDSDFAENGTANDNTAGHIKLYGYTNGVTLTGLTIVGGSGGAAPNTAIELIGTPNDALAGGSFPIGAVVIDGVTITGAFDKSPVSVYNFENADGLSIVDLDVSGASNSGAAWPVLNVDGIAGGIDGSGYVITLAPGQVIALQGEKPAQGEVSNIIVGTDYDDVLIGKSGGDTLFGGQGDDHLLGGDGNDLLFGGEGNDRLEGGAGTNELDGGDGIDTAVFATDVSIVWNAVTGWWAGSDLLTNVEIVEAGSARYLLVGAGGFDSLTDALAAAEANDTILLAPGYEASGDFVIGAHLTGLTIKGLGVRDADSSVAGTASVVEGRIVVLANGVTLENLRIEEGGGASTGFSSAYDTAGVVAVGSGLTVKDSTFFRSGTVDGDGFRGIINAVGQGAGLSVSNSVFQGWATGLYSNGIAGLVVNQNIFTNNFVGMSLDAYGTTGAVTVTGNQFLNQVLEGLGVGSHAGGSLGAGSSVSGNGFTGPGVYVYGGVANATTISGNTFNGTAGNDTLTDDANGSGRVGISTYQGGNGTDTVDYGLATSNLTVVLSSGATNGSVAGAPGGTDVLVSVENVITGSGNDTVTAGSGTTSISTGGGNDTINYALAAGTIAINGGAGTDQLNVTGTTTEYVISGTNKSVTMTTASGATVNATDLETIRITTGNGNKVIDASALSGTSSSSTTKLDIVFGNGNDTYYAAVGGAFDTINGGAGVDTLDFSKVTGGTGVGASLESGLVFFGGGADTVTNFENIRGSDFQDILTGNAGNNVFYATKGGDQIDGGAGVDTFDASHATSDLIAQLDFMVVGEDVNGAPGGQSTRLTNIENLFSGSGDDTLIGNAAANHIKGGAGNDWIRGLGGNDHLEGGEGDDRLEGGEGNDILDGGAGVDTIVYAGNRSNYRITFDATTGSGTITALLGNEGTDTFTGIEFLEFADQTIAWGDAPPPSAPRMDFDGDGSADILRKQSSNWYSFVESDGATGSLKQWGGGRVLAAVADFNGDGQSDLLFKTSAGNLALVTSDTYTQSHTYIAGVGKTFVGLGDLNGDGATDLVYKNASGTYSYRTSASATQETVLGNYGSRELVAMADLNGDGQDELILRADAGSGSYWYSYVDLNSTAADPVVSLGRHSRDLVGIGDFDGDGKQDLLLLRVTSPGQLIDYYSYLSVETGTATNSLGSVPKGLGFVGIGNFNGNTTDDVLLVDGAGNLSYLDNSVLISLGNLGGRSVVGIDDYNGDGVTDILLQSGSSLQLAAGGDLNGAVTIHNLAGYELLADNNGVASGNQVLNGGVLAGLATDDILIA